MKTFLSILTASAAVAGIVYLLKDNEDVKDSLGKAKEKASGAFDKMKGAFYQSKGEVRTQVAELS